MNETGTEILFTSNWPKITSLVNWLKEHPFKLNKSSRLVDLDEDLRKMEEAKRKKE